MKKALFLCFGLLLTLATSAWAAPANALFFSERGIPFQLIFDGYAVTRGSTPQVQVDRITPGLHWAEFRIPTPYGRAVSYRTRVFLDPGLETRFVLVARSGFPPALRKVAAVPIRYGGRYPAAPAYPPAYPTYPDRYPRDPATGDDLGYDGPTDPVPLPNGTYGTDNGYDAPASPSYGAGNTAPSPTLNATDAEALVQFLRSKSFDDSRLLIAKQALDESLVRAADLRRMLQTFSHESNRLELAKYAYPRVADRQNFYQVYDAFTFDTNLQELQRFVGRQR